MSRSASASPATLPIWLEDATVQVALTGVTAEYETVGITSDLVRDLPDYMIYGWVVEDGATRRSPRRQIRARAHTVRDGTFEFIDAQLDLGAYGPESGPIACVYRNGYAFPREDPLEVIDYGRSAELRARGFASESIVVRTVPSPAPARIDAIMTAMGQATHSRPSGIPIPVFEGTVETALRDVFLVDIDDPDVPGFAISGWVIEPGATVTSPLRLVTAVVPADAAWIEAQTRPYDAYAADAADPMEDIGYVIRTTPPTRAPAP